MVGGLWESLVQSSWSPELNALGMPFMPLCWFSACNWVLIVVGSFFGVSFPPAGWLRVTPPTTSLCYCASALFFSFWICLWWCQILTLSDLRQPASDLLSGLSPSVVNLVLLHLAGLRTMGWGRISPEVGAIVLPQAAAALMGVVCLSRMAAAGWGVT